MEIPLLTAAADNTRKNTSVAKNRWGEGINCHFFPKNKKLQFLSFPVLGGFASYPITNLKKHSGRQEINKNLTKVAAFGIKIDGKY